MPRIDGFGVVSYSATRGATDVFFFAKGRILERANDCVHALWASRAVGNFHGEAVHDAGEKLTEGLKRKKAGPYTEREGKGTNKL